jgi:hypothetical protein
MSFLSHLVFPIESKPFGYTYGEWSARWWRWLLAVPKSENPAYDSRGAKSYINQNNPDVFFLCQTYQEGQPSIPNRSVNIAADSSIFMPIINWISVLNHDGDTDHELIETATKRMDAVGNLQITINDLTIENGLQEYRAQSPFFDINLPEDNIIGSRPGVTRAISDGYWLFIKPLKRKTKIISYASCSSGLTRIGVNYTLYVQQCNCH